jgi:hypothetical protein
VKHGKDAPGGIPSEGVLSLISTGPGSVAIVGGVLYVDGKAAPPGIRKYAFRNGTLPIAIKAGGKPEFHAVEPKGV